MRPLAVAAQANGIGIGKSTVYQWMKRGDEAERDPDTGDLLASTTSGM